MEKEANHSDKWAFVAKSMMTFAQILTTGVLASQVIKNLTISWRIAFIGGIFLLIVMAVVMYPAKVRSEK